MIKKITLALTLILTYSYSNAQTDWTKSSRTILFEDCLSSLSKYKALSTIQKESIALCYLDELTNKYTKKEYDAKIEVELQRIQSSAVLHCTKNLGLELEKVESKEEIEFGKKGLFGGWKSSNCDIYLNEDGSYFVKFTNGSTRSGKWHLEDKNIVLTKLATLKVVAFTGKTMKYIQGGEVWDVTKIQ